MPFGAFLGFKHATITYFFNIYILILIKNRYILAEWRTMIELFIYIVFFFKFTTPIFVKTNVKRATANVMPGAVAKQPAD